MAGYTPRDLSEVELAVEAAIHDGPPQRALADIKTFINERVARTRHLGRLVHSIDVEIHLALAQLWLKRGYERKLSPAQIFDDVMGLFDHMDLVTIAD